jgi:hypothetical protein
MTFAYEGSYNDVRHVHAMARGIERIAKQSKNGARMLFILPPLHAKPPDEKVRRALVDMTRRHQSKVALLSLVIGGTGFGAAMHRGVATGLLSLARPTFRCKVEGTIHAGLSYLLDSKSAVFQPLLRFCEEHALGPAAEHPALR